jgi:FkbM family methyltransferase
LLKKFPPNLAVIKKKVDGITFLLDLREEVDFALYIDPDYNRKELSFFEEHLSATGTFLDIGANIGFFSLMVAKSFPLAQIIAFEPEPFSVGGIESNIKLNGLSNIRIEKYAISSHSGTVSFRVNKSGNRGGSGIDIKNDKEVNEIIMVPCKKLQDALNECHISTVDSMKIDIEGHEYNALNTFFSEAPRTLWPTAIISEAFGYSIKPGGESVIQFLIEKGYDLVDHTDYNFFFILKKV